MHESREQVQAEERKQRKAQEKFSAAERESAARATHLEDMDRRLQSYEDELQQERGRGDTMGRADELADQVAELEAMEKRARELEALAADDDEEDEDEDEEEYDDEDAE